MATMVYSATSSAAVQLFTNTSYSISKVVSSSAASGVVTGATVYVDLKTSSMFESYTVRVGVIPRSVQLTGGQSNIYDTKTITFDALDRYQTFVFNLPSMTVDEANTLSILWIECTSNNGSKLYQFGDIDVSVNYTEITTPAAPTALYMNGGAYNYGEAEPGTSYTLSWYASTSSSVSYYKVGYKDNSSTTYTIVGNTTSLQMTVYASSAYSTTRTFYVAAVNSSGISSEWSTASRSVTTKAAPASSGVTAPTSLYFSGYTGNVTGAELNTTYFLMWSGATGSISSYQVYSKVPPNDYYSLYYTVDYTSNGLAITTPNTYSTTWSFMVRVVGTDGTYSGFTDAISITTKTQSTTTQCTPPTILYLNGYAQDLSGQEPGASATLYWEGATGSIAGYRVWSYIDTDDSFKQCGDTTTTQMTVYASDSYSTTKNFYVQTLCSDSSLNSGFSSPRVITTKAAPVSSGVTIPYYNGTTWLDATPWYYNGSCWISPKMWYYDGIEWLHIPPLPKYSFAVEDVPGSYYKFVEQSDGYWESNNKGVDSSYAMCKVKIVTDGTQAVYFDCINYGESSWDYGILSNVDATLSLSSAADSTNVKHSFYGMAQNSVQSVYYDVLPAGEHYIYVKYRKDNSNSINPDSLKFKVRFVQPFSECSYIVSALPGYNRFTLNGNGYYESTNKGDDYSNSYALCKVNIVADGVHRMYVDYINDGESGWDYGLISKLNTELGADDTKNNSSNVHPSFIFTASSSVQTLDYGVLSAGEHYIYAKYLKDGSLNKEPDSLQFKVRFV